MGGRPPKSNEYHELTKPKLYGQVAARAENTPRPVKKLKPVCPRNFTKEQRKQWNKYGRALKNYNIFTIANQTTLEMLAIYKNIFDEHRIALDSESALLDNPNGMDIYNKNFKVMNKVEPIIGRCLSKLGLSSSDLAKIGALVAGAKKKTKMEELLD